MDGKRLCRPPSRKINPLPVPTDAMLLERSKAGDNQAKGLLFQRYWKSVYLFSLRLLVDPDIAKDAAQNALIKALDSLAMLDKPEALRTWLLTITRNEVFTLLRRQRRNGVESLENYSHALDDHATPLDEIILQERTEIIQHALHRLKPAFREVLILREYEQLSYVEIAAITESTESAVKSRLFHARKAMLEQLRPYFHERKLV